MRKKMKFLSAALLLLVTFGATFKAQTIKPKPVDKVQAINPKAEILSSSEKIVKRAPFSAEAISESVQIMFDGNRIVQRVNTRLYRDSEGRFRRDDMPKPVALGSFVEMPQVIFILDPVAGLKFYLYPDSKTARQFDFKTQKSDWDLAKAEQEIKKNEQEIGKAEERFEKTRQELEKRRAGVSEQERKIIDQEIERLKQQIENQKARLEARKQRFRKRAASAEPEKWETQKPQPGEKQTDKKPPIENNNQSSDSSSNNSSNSDSSSNSSVTENGKPAKVATDAKAVKTVTKSNPSKTPPKPNEPNLPSLPVPPKGEEKTESLGTRNIEGVEAEGVRQTTTVPAGAIGNERPIEIVYERWYSKDLELIVFSKFTDPRFGEQTYRLTNIKRAEPDSTLFTPPADYKLLTEPEKIPRITVPRKKFSLT